jgi:hypothetical protein
MARRWPEEKIDMKYRQKMSKKSSRRQFNKTVNKTHKKNLYNTGKLRDGHRL